jgi:pyruvate kinase
MIDSGMDVMCCNFASGDHASHGNAIEHLGAALRQREEKQCATMMITKGPEIRTGRLAEANKVSLVAGQTLEIHSDMNVEGNDMSVACSYKGVADSVQAGAQILIDDGKIVCEVTEVVDGIVKTQVKNDSLLKEDRPLHIPNTMIDLPTISERDELDIQFGVKSGIDIIAVSMTRKPDEIE